MANIGYAFQPGAQNSIGTNGRNGGPGGGNGNLRPQSAVEIKSLNLPQQRNIPGAISSPALLNASGGSAFGPQLLQMLMQAFAPQGQQPGVPSLAPTPFLPPFLGDRSQPSQGNRGSDAPRVGPMPVPNLPSAQPASFAPHVIAGLPPGRNPNEEVGYGNIGAIDSLPGYVPPPAPTPQVPLERLMPNITFDHPPRQPENKAEYREATPQGFDLEHYERPSWKFEFPRFLEGFQF